MKTRAALLLLSPLACLLAACMPGASSAAGLAAASVRTATSAVATAVAPKTPEEAAKARYLAYQARMNTLAAQYQAAKTPAEQDAIRKQAADTYLAYMSHEAQAQRDDAAIAQARTDFHNNVAKLPSFKGELPAGVAPPPINGQLLPAKVEGQIPKQLQ